MANKQELAKQANLALKQDKLIAGTNILIAQDGKTISAIGGGSTVSITPFLLTGIPIASCSIDGSPFTLYAPQGSTNYYGTTNPSPSVGDNGSIYLKYNSTTGDIIAIYGKVQNVWKEVQMGGGGGLPENWICNEDYLIAYDPDAELNVLGWIPHIHTYYLDETVTNFSLGERVYNKEYPIPALGGVIGDPTQSIDRAIVLVSTEPTATYFEWNGYTNHQGISLNYLGHTWYYSGGQANYNGSPSGIAVIPDDTLSLENAAKYLIDNSDISFSTGGKFTVMSQPSSDNDILFAGGGEESDLSDATFLVSSDGIVNGADFKINGTSVTTPFTGADGTDAGTSGMVPAPSATDNNKYLKGDGTWDAGTSGTSVIANPSGIPTADLNTVSIDNVIYNIAGGGGGGSGSYTETVLWSDPNGIVSSSDPTISLSDNISNYDIIVFYVGRDNGAGVRCGDVMYLVSDIPLNTWHIQTVNQNDNLHMYWCYTSDTSITIASAYSAYPWILYSLKGLKFGGGSPSHTYSTTEQIIGKWIDGRDIYERTIDLGSFSVGSWSDHTIESSTSIDLLIDYDGYIVESNITYALPDPSVRIKVDSNQNLIFTGTASWSISSGYITIRYTKTTS